MAKAVKIKIKLESSAGTGSFYLAEKNPRTHPEKLVLKKFDKKYWSLINHVLVLHGRKYCIARRPQCDTCPISDLCPKND